MDEFWVCQHCRSLNRVGTGRCYHCREKFGSLPKQAEVVNRNSGAPGPTPLPMGPVGLPGLGRPGQGGMRPPPGQDGPGAEPPTYLSRPVALDSTPVRTFSAPQAQVKPERHFKRPQLTGWIRRRIALSLATRQTVSVWFVGYVAAGLLMLLLLDATLILATVTPIAGGSLQSGSIASAWGQVDSGHQWTLEMLAIAFAGIGVLALLFLSIFTGLSTHNAPGLGAETPQLSPYHGGTCWLGVLWAQARIAAGLLAPAILIWIGYPLPGLIVALVAVELGQRSLDDPFGWLTNPARHLPDLFAKLGGSGSNSSLLGSAWSACFRAANILAIAVYALPLAALIAVAVADVARRSDLLVWQSSGFGPVQLATAAIVVLLVLATFGAIGLLVPISIELVNRQRTRRTLVRVGPSRPWAARPANYNAPAQDSGPARYDPYERSNELQPDQASLNSPSTTSSFPWDDDVSEEVPPD